MKSAVRRALSGGADPQSSIAWLGWPAGTIAGPTGPCVVMARLGLGELADDDVPPAHAALDRSIEIKKAVLVRTASGSRHARRRAFGPA